MKGQPEIKKKTLCSECGYDSKQTTPSAKKNVIHDTNIQMLETKWRTHALETPFEWDKTEKMEKKTIDFFFLAHGYAEDTQGRATNNTSRTPARMASGAITDSTFCRCSVQAGAKDVLYLNPMKMVGLMSKMMLSFHISRVLIYICCTIYVEKCTFLSLRSFEGVA